DAFGRDPGLAPTHWGPDSRTRDLFDRDRLIGEVTAYQSEFYVPVLRRRKAPAYEAFFSAKSSGLNYAELRVKGPVQSADAPRFFALGDALANALTPELAFVHPVWNRGEESQLYSASGVLSLKELQEYGLNPVCARTWYGSRLVSEIGRERLAQAGLRIENTRGGGVRVDLVQDPSQSDFETLQRRQTEAMAALVPSGLYADYTRFNDFVPGPRWVPIPG
ncbi:MAG: hypothetical protein H7Z41_13660, partial [Cytophagales bacterium]|nr:hypothetical protein [Armatimonadota bacterium]